MPNKFPENFDSPEGPLLGGLFQRRGTGITERQEHIEKRGSELNIRLAMRDSCIRTTWRMNA